MPARLIIHPALDRVGVAIFHKKSCSLVLSVTACFVLLFQPWVVHAAEIRGGSLGERSLDAGSNKVTVTVLDVTPPSPPILVSPTNNSYVVTRLPTFVWKASTDTNPIDHYQLWIDGKLHVDLIPTVSYQNSFYSLIYDSLTQQYSLTLKKNLAEGAHTWKILAFDTALNSNSSATWNFTIDTLSPNFIITNIGKLPVTISAYDPTTIPSNPIELDVFNNEPLLVGTGEPHSRVILTLTIPGGEGRTYMTTIDKDGKWSIQLGILPRDTVIPLSFVIEDQAGLITILEGISLIITDSGLSGGGIRTPTPTPAQSSQTDTTFELTNFWPFADWHPIFTKKLAPIKAFVYSLFEQVLTYLPPAIAIPLSYIPTQPTGDQAWLLSWLNWFIALVTPFLLVLSVLIHYKFQIPISGLLQIFKACHLWPLTTGLLPAKPGGWVMDPLTNMGVAFAKVRLFNLEKDQQVDECITDEKGFFPSFNYLADQPEGEKYLHYRLTVEKQGSILDFGILQQTWPVKTLPSFIYLHNTYQGGIVSFTHQKPAPFWIVPVTTRAETLSDKILNTLARANLLPPLLFFHQLVLTFLVLVFYSTLPNTLVVLYYVVLAGARIGRMLQVKNFSVQLIDEQQKPISAGLILCRPIYDPTTIWIGKTDKHGFARFRLTDPTLSRTAKKDQQYLVTCHKDGMHPVHKRHLLGASKLSIGSSPSAQLFSMSETQPQTSCCKL